MFGTKKSSSAIDKDQLELVKNAHKRIRQKKQLLTHFFIFLIGSVLLIILNLVLGIGIDVVYFGLNWWVYAVSLWAFILLYHAVNVLLVNKILNKTWEEKQLNKLIAKQEKRIDELKKQLPEDYTALKSNTQPKQNITLLVAASENNAIGKDGKLIWKLKSDLQRFKELTTGHFIIMGRKTFESLPGLLPDRKHIVVTRQKGYDAPKGVFVVHNMENAIELTNSDPQPFIIGGSDIFKEGFELAHTIELTTVHEVFNDADAFLPPIDTTKWLETNRTFYEKDKDNEYDYSFITYTKIKN